VVLVAAALLIPPDQQARMGQTRLAETAEMPLVPEVVPVVQAD
jgi:hypothetical protein